MLRLAATVLRGVQQRLGRKSKTQGAYTYFSWLQKKLLKHQEDQSVKQVSLGKSQLFYRRPYEVLHTYDELFEQGIYAFPSDRPDPLIVDCGANIGISVLYFKNLFPNARIIAFEPDPGNFDLLQQNVRANSLENVDLRQAAVWNRHETLHFVQNGSQDSRVVDASDTARQTIDVQGFRLADLLQAQEVDCLKIDVEGAENLILQDCLTELARVRFLFVEYHGKTQETAKLRELLDIFERAGLNVYVKTAADSIQQPFVQAHTGYAFDVQLNLFGRRDH
ncbi:MAG: FkbM family methyltransferase [Sphingobacteriales bacterium]|nr:MAG: FkbM family methyltransferase [Sphingobacteriales bacterium]